MQVRLTSSPRVLALCLVATGALAAQSPVGGGVAAMGGVAAESSKSDYQTASLRFIESAPGRASGYRVRIDYTNPDDPEAKPPSVRRVVEVFARGTRIDTSAPARCAATDAELMLAGRSACPRGSIVGNGFIKLDTGMPGPGRYLKEDVTFLNNTNELIYLTKDRATGARTVVRARVRRWSRDHGVAHAARGRDRRHCDRLRPGQLSEAGSDARRAPSRLCHDSAAVPAQGLLGHPSPFRLSRRDHPDGTHSQPLRPLRSYV